MSPSAVPAASSSPDGLASTVVKALLAENPESPADETYLTGIKFKFEVKIRGFLCQNIKM
jgi:hypothetical protein